MNKIPRKAAVDKKPPLGWAEMPSNKRVQQTRSPSVQVRSTGLEAEGVVPGVRPGLMSGLCGLPGLTSPQGSTLESREAHWMSHSRVHALAAVMTFLGFFAGSASVSDGAAGLVDQSPGGAWYALPAVDDQQCPDISPLPWCEAPTIPVLRRFFADIGAPFRVLGHDIETTISRYATCWIQLRGYATCSQQMCLAAGVSPEDGNPALPIMLVTVYGNRPSSHDHEGISEYELGPSFGFDLKPITWRGPHERSENATPCEERTETGHTQN